MVNGSRGPGGPGAGGGRTRLLIFIFLKGKDDAAKAASEGNLQDPECYIDPV